MGAGDILWPVNPASPRSSARRLFKAFDSWSRSMMDLSCCRCKHADGVASFLLLPFGWMEGARAQRTLAGTLNQSCEKNVGVPNSLHSFLVLSFLALSSNSKCHVLD